MGQLGGWMRSPRHNQNAKNLPTHPDPSKHGTPRNIVTNSASTVLNTQLRNGLTAHDVESLTQDGTVLLLVFVLVKAKPPVYPEQESKLIDKSALEDISVCVVLSATHLSTSVVGVNNNSRSLLQAVLSHLAA